MTRAHKAIADYTEAIRLNPEFADAYYNRGNAYKAKAEADFAKAEEHPLAGDRLIRRR